MRVEVTAESDETNAGYGELSLNGDQIYLRVFNRDDVWLYDVRCSLAFGSMKPEVTIGPRA